MMTDIRKLIDEGPFTAMQIGVIAICILMNMLDGMDVMVISYAAPSLSEEWGIAATALGIVFSAALLGMTLGGMLIAPFADVLGRRNVIVACIVVMSGAVLLTAVTQEVWQLVVLRFVSGLGIGSMLASTVTLASEYTPERQRNFVVGAVLAGYPIGATLFGLAAARIVPAHGWRAIFVTAGVATFITLPLAWLFLAESWEWLIKKQPVGALEKLNASLLRMGHPQIDRLPSIPAQKLERPGLGALFSHGRGEATTKLWLAFFMGFATLYFLTTWIPNLARSTGLSVELAIYAGTVFNLGAIFGNLSQGWLSQQVGLRKAIVTFYLATAIQMVVFGYISGSWTVLLIFGLIGFCVQGGLIGLYAVAARLYPTEVRNTGVGWAIGAGRTGAIISPTIGGGLIAAGLSMASSFLVFAAPLIVACGSIWAVRSKDID